MEGNEKDVLTLSKKERLNFINQFKILDKLYPDEGYRENIKALEEGYELHYSWIFENLYNGLSIEQCRFVLDVLGVYRAMIFSFENLENKEGIDIELLRFPGFDGNNETEYMSYVRYFIDDLGRFEEIREISGSGFNSHKKLIDSYSNLLTKYNSLPKITGGLIKRDDLLVLLKIAPKGL